MTSMVLTFNTSILTKRTACLHERRNVLDFLGIGLAARGFVKLEPHGFVKQRRGRFVIRIRCFSNFYESKDPKFLRDVALMPSCK